MGPRHSKPPLRGAALVMGGAADGLGAGEYGPS